MAKARKPSPAARLEARAEFEAVCRAMLAGLHDPVTRVFRRIVRAAPKTDDPLYFVIWEWSGDHGPGVTIGLEDNRPPFRSDFAGVDEIDWRAWSRRLGEDSWDFFRGVLTRVLGEWWAGAGGSDYARRAVIGEHDFGDWADLLTGRPVGRR